MFYKETTLQKYYIADMICYDKISVELKALNQLTDRETAQILNYLKVTGFRVGLPINFGSTGRLEWQRLVFYGKLCLKTAMLPFW